MQLLDGKKTAQDIKDEIQAEVAQMKLEGKKVPHLAAVLVGNDGASLTYVGSKVRSCEQVGIQHLPYISRLFLFVFFFVLMFFKP